MSCCPLVTEDRGPACAKVHKASAASSRTEGLGDVGGTSSILNDHFYETVQNSSFLKKTHISSSANGVPFFLKCHLYQVSPENDFGIWHGVFQQLHQGQDGAAGGDGMLVLGMAIGQVAQGHNGRALKKGDGTVALNF